MNHPELWDDNNLDALATIVYESCKNKDCDKCPHRLEVNGETCKTDIINDLWRHWKNTSKGKDEKSKDILRRFAACKRENDRKCLDDDCEKCPHNYSEDELLIAIDTLCGESSQG